MVNLVLCRAVVPDFADHNIANSIAGVKLRSSLAATIYLSGRLVIKNELISVECISSTSRSRRPPANPAEPRSITRDE